MSKSNIHVDNFNDDQNKAINKLADFVKSDKPSITLSGAAGTGKTYLLNYFLNKVFLAESCISAPTHKAVRIVEKATHKKGMTLHSLHGLRPNTDIANFNISNPQFDPLAEPKINNYRLLAIDEASQINKGINKLNVDRAKLYDVKIVYIGDEYQLPPVKERISSVFTDNEVIRLNKIMRQEEDNTLLPLFVILRNDIMTNRSNFLHALKNNPMGINSKNHGYIVLDESNFYMLMERKFREEPSTRFLGWKKATVAEENYNIRNMINEDINILNVNDVVTGYNTIHDDFNEEVIVNSVDYTIQSIENITNDYDFNVYLVTFVSEFGEVSTPIEVINHRHKSFNNYVNILNQLHSLAYSASFGSRKQRWAEYYTFKKKIISMVDIPLSHSKYDISKDISYAYGLTIHKSQGSTYKNVFIDIKDLLYYTNGNQVRNSGFNPYAVEFRNKLLYVAFSRASNIVFIKA